MGVFTRFSDIVNSNINSMLDKAENPEKMINMIIEEMEQTLVEVRSVSARTIAEKKELQRKQESLVKEAGYWEEKAELAVNKERDDLAKSALAEKHSREKTAASVQDELTRVESELAKLGVDMTQLQDKLNDAKARRNALIARRNSVTTRLNAKRKSVEYNIDEAMAKFESFHQRIDQLEAEIESYDMVQNKSLGQQIDELGQQDTLDEDLAKLKKRLKKAS